MIIPAHFETFLVCCMLSDSFNDQSFNNVLTFKLRAPEKFMQFSHSYKLLS